MRQKSDSETGEFVFDNAPTDSGSSGAIPDLLGQMGDLPGSRRKFLSNAAKVGAGAAALGAVGTGTAAAAHADEPYSNSPYEDKNQFGYGALTDVEIVRFALLLERLEATFYTQAVGTAPVGEGGGGSGNFPFDDDFPFGDDEEDDEPLFGDDFPFGDDEEDDEGEEREEDEEDDEESEDGEGGDGKNRMGGRISEREIETSESALQFAAEPDLRKSTFEYFQRIRNHEQDHVTALEGVLNEVGANPDFASGVKFTFDYDTADEFIDIAQTLEDTGAGAYTAAAPAVDTEKYLAAAAQIALVEGRHASYLRVLTPQSQVPFPRSFQRKLSVSTVAQRVLPFVKGVDEVSEVVALVKTGNSDPSG